MADYCKAMLFKIKLIKINLMKQIAVCDYAVLQKLGHFNFSDWQKMHTTLSSLCWANVGRIYGTISKLGRATCDVEPTLA